MSDRLLPEMVGFGRKLRDLGVSCPTSALVDFIRSLDACGVTRLDDVRLAAYATLASAPEHRLIIDGLLGASWPDMTALDAGAPVMTSVSQAEGSSRASRSERPDEVVGKQRLGETDSNTENRRPSSGGVSMYSAVELLGRKDFSRLSDTELEDYRRFLLASEWRFLGRSSRRRRPSRRGNQVDVRRILQRTVHTGDIVALPRLGPKAKPRRLVLLCDVSGSMDQYTRALLRFLHAVRSGLSAAEIFVFGTRLTRITPLLRHKDVDQAIWAVSAQVQDWAGGTRIGDSIGAFNRVWARRVAAHGAIVIVISDGWDRGDVRQLSQEVRRLQRLSHRLVWLNPLLGTAGYRPLTAGIQAVLPLVDDFLPCHNIASLEAVAHLLNRLGPSRPRRTARRRASA